MCCCRCDRGSLFFGAQAKVEKFTHHYKSTEKSKNMPLFGLAGQPQKRYFITKYTLAVRP
jgi:hypothetical protein